MFSPVISLIACPLVAAWIIFQFKKVSRLQKQLAEKTSQVHLLREHLEATEQLSLSYCKDATDKFMALTSEYTAVSLQFQHLTIENTDLQAKGTLLRLENYLLLQSQQKLTEEKKNLIRQGKNWALLNENLIQTAHRLIAVIKEITQCEQMRSKCEEFLFKQELDKLLASINIIRNQSESQQKEGEGQ